jgi:hypothetical protein
MAMLPRVSPMSGEYDGYLLLTMLIAGLGAVVAWMLYGQSE